MNKKLLLGAALLVGMGTAFTSCVDSTESASVTAVREAKAEQLKSIADLNKAQAQAALILAQAEQAAQAANQAYQEAQATQLAAEAEYLKAQAALFQAQAEVEKAKAAAMNAQTENEKQLLEAELQKKELERQLLQAELDKKAQDLKDQIAEADKAQQLLVAELAKLEQIIEGQKIQNLINKQIYENMVQKAIDDAEDRADNKAVAEATRYAAEYQRLEKKYNDAADYLVSCQRQVAVAKAKLMNIQAQLTSAENSIKSSIQSDETLRAEYLNKIAGFQAIIDELSDLAGTEVTPEVVAQAKVACEQAKAAYEAASDAMTEKFVAKTEAFNVMTNSQYVQDLTNFCTNSRGYYYGKDKMENELYTTFRIRLVPESETEAPAECLGKYALVVTERVRTYNTGYNYDNGTWDGWNPPTMTYVPVSDYYQSWDLSYTEETPDPVIEGSDPEVSYKVYTSNYNLIDNGAGLNEWLKYEEKAIAYQNSLYDPEEAKAALDKALAELNGGKYTDEDGKEVEVKVGAQAAFNTANTAYETAKKAYEKAEGELEAARDAYNNPEEGADMDALFEELQAKQKAYNEAYAKLYGGSYTNDKNETVTVKPEDSADQVNKTAYNALNKAISNVNEKTEEYNEAVNNLNAVPALENYKEQIAAIIAATADNEKNIEAVNKAEKEYAEATVAYNTANDAFSVAQSAYTTACQVLYSHVILENTNYLQGDDPQLNDLVSYANQKLEEYNGYLETVENRLKVNNAKLDEIKEGKNPNNVYYESTVAEYQAYVEEAEQNYQLAKDRYDIAKSELESFVKNHEEK